MYKIQALRDATASAKARGGSTNMTDRRKSLVSAAQELIAELRELGREPSEAEKSVLAEAAAALEELDASIEKADASGDILAKIAGARQQDGFGGGGYSGGYSGSGGFDTEERLNFRAKAATVNISAKMADPSGQKAIASSGDAITGVPLDSTLYEQGRVSNSALAILPFRTRPPQYSYLRQTTRTNNAAPVAVGELKSTSTYGLTSVDGRLEVVAHVSEPTPEFWLEDNRSLQSFIQTEMQYGLERAVENQVLNGDGTSPNLRGLLNTSGVQVAPFDTDATVTVRRGITLLETVGHTGGGIILHPSDWEALELARRTSGDFDLGSSLPVDRAAQRLWGLRIAVSIAVPVGTGVLFDLAALAVVGDGAVRTQWSSGVADDFSRNQVRARTEGRFGVDIYQPQGIVKVELAAAAPE